MTFTDEELSRILSAHAGGQLKRSGEDWYDFAFYGDGYMACIIQAGKCMAYAAEAARVDRDLARWFDRAYREHWTPARLLREIEKRTALSPGSERGGAK